MTVTQFVQQWVEQADHELAAARSNRQNSFYDTCFEVMSTGIGMVAEAAKEGIWLK